MGCGYWGPNLIRNFLSLKGCEVAKICDTSIERLNRMQEIYPDIETTTDFDAILADKDLSAVAIATPVNTHFGLAKKSLMAGKHTFLEKPMASSADQCRELINIAERRHLTLMVGHTFIYSAPVRYIKQIVESGELGDVLYISSQRLNLGLFQKDINVTWDLAPHDISIVLYLLNRLPSTVNCQGRSHVHPTVEDVTNMTLGFDNGAMALIHNSWLDPHKVRKMTIVGSKRMVVYDDNKPLEKLRIYDRRVNSPPHYETYAEFHYSYHYGDISIPYLKQAEPLKDQCSHFLYCIRNKTTPETSGQMGLQVVDILEAASASLKNDGSKVFVQTVRDRTIGTLDTCGSKAV